MKRKLSNEEKAICAKSLIQAEDEIKYNEYQVETCDRMIKKGLELDYRKKLRDTKQLKREFESELKMANEKINVLKEQMRNGVEMKGGKNAE